MRFRLSSRCHTYAGLDAITSHEIVAVDSVALNGKTSYRPNRIPVRLVASKALHFTIKRNKSTFGHTCNGVNIYLRTTINKFCFATINKVCLWPFNKRVDEMMCFWF
jgi:hypothetical protein